MPEIGDIVAKRYAIEGHLGQGAASVVFRAKDLLEHRLVALKLLKNHSNYQSIERFRRELEVSQELQSPYVLPILDSGREWGRYYLVTPFFPDSFTAEDYIHRLRIQRHYAPQSPA